MIREAFDDFNRFLRDRDVNNQKYKKLTRTGVVSVESARIKVGDLIIVEKVRVGLEQLSLWQMSPLTASLNLYLSCILTLSGCIGAMIMLIHPEPLIFAL